MSLSARPALLACALVASFSMLALPGDVDAGAALTTATDNCNGALPGYEGALRKRPLGILNEGTSSAFVSCGVSVDSANSLGTNAAVVYLINRGTVTQAVTCTFIDGLPAEFNDFEPDLPIATFHPQAIAVLPGQLGIVQWLPDDFELERFSVYGAFNCNLPPKMEISVAGVSWDEPPAP